MVLPDYQIWNCSVCIFAITLKIYITYYLLYSKLFSPSYGIVEIYMFLFIWQMLIKIISAILAVILEAFGAYCEGEFKGGCG